MKTVNLKEAKPSTKNPRSNFDLSFKRKFDFKFGQLIPAVMLPVMPGDEISLSFEHLVRFAPFVSQVYQTFTLSFDFYYVPNRVVYHNFNNFFSAGYNGRSEYIPPYISLSGFNSFFQNPNYHGTIFDYLDLPPLFCQNARPDDKINALPLGAYMKVIMDYWLGTDTSLQKLNEDYPDGGFFTDGNVNSDFSGIYSKLVYGTYVTPTPSATSNFYELFKPVDRLYPLDYFTSARSQPQLGPAMTIPLELINTDSDGSKTFSYNIPMTQSGTFPLVVDQDPSTQTLIIHRENAGAGHLVVNGTVFKNQALINDFYSAARVQELLSLYGYSGFLPADSIAAEYNVRNSDSRLQRAQFLGHDQFDVQIGEVFSNNVNYAPDTQIMAQDVAGVGTAIGKATGSGRGFRTKINEHGWLVGLVSLYPEASYYQGVPKHFYMLDRFDYPRPKLANLAMQAIKKSEVIATDQNISRWDDDFAYLPPYSNYKTGINRVNGSLRDELQYMTAGRELSDTNSVDGPKVNFNDRFLRVSPLRNDLDRVFNVISYSQYDSPLFADIKFNIFANRELPYFGLPQF